MDDFNVIVYNYIQNGYRELERLFETERIHFNFIEEINQLNTHNNADLIIINFAALSEKEFETIKGIKKINLREAPVLMLIEEQNFKNVLKAMDVGVNDFLLKPFTNEELVARIRTQNELCKTRKIVNEQIQVLQEQKTALESERKKTRTLLLNILPKKIVSDLQVGNKPKTELFPSATIMFTDFRNFSKTCEFLSPELLVNTLETYFTNFDSIIEQFNIEKIKTVGDAYMCVGGIPTANLSHPIEMVLAAMEITSFIKSIKHEYPESEMFLWDIRIGINTGEIIAGVIGKTKFTYDVWGDAVNIASRLETYGEINKVTISVHTYKLVKKYFECTYKDKVPIKGERYIDAYIVERIKPEYSSDEEGICPNKKFKAMIDKLAAREA